MFDASLNSAIDYVVIHGDPVLKTIAFIVKLFIGVFSTLLTVTPPLITIAVVTLVALWRKGIAFAVFAGLSLLLVRYLNLWDETISTLSLVLGSACLSVIIGIPLGIWAARSPRAETVLRTTMDFMQTMPAFVYLIPAVMFFGLGAVPGTFATVIFAMPPAVRLTALGIKQVPAEMVEAARAFGATERQLLFKVQLPNAMPSIMAGVNQTLMMSLSMVVIASMIGAGGLGNVVLTGIQRLDIALGLKGGLAVVLLAIILDRITQSLGDVGAAGRSSAVRGWIRRALPARERVAAH